MEFLENRRSRENQKPPESRQKSGLFWASPFTMRLVCTLLIHAQNSRPNLSAFLSNFTFSNPKFIHTDFLLTGETSIDYQILPEYPSPLGAHLRGRTATQRSKKKVLRRVLGGGLRRVLRRGLFFVGFYSKNGFREGFSEGVLRRAFPGRCLEHPLGEYDPLGVSPILSPWCEFSASQGYVQ